MKRIVIAFIRVIDKIVIANNKDYVKFSIIITLSAATCIDLTERFERLIKRVLAGIGIEPPEDIGGCVLLEFDSSDKLQKLIPVFADQRVIDSLVRLNFPIFFNPVFRFENIKGLLTNALDARGERKTQQMGEAESRFGVAVCVGGMDVTFGVGVGVGVVPF